MGSTGKYFERFVEGVSAGVYCLNLAGPPRFHGEEWVEVPGGDYQPLAPAPKDTDDIGSCGWYESGGAW